MAVLPLAAISFIMHVILWFWVFIALALILIVLIQKGKGGGIGAAFGGAMASSLLGTKTGDWLTKVTIGVVAIFLLMAVFLDKFYRPTVSSELGGVTTTAPASTSNAQGTDAATDGSQIPDTETDSGTGNSQIPAVDADTSGANSGTVPPEGTPATDGGAGQQDGQ